jgi:hypothetical protein
LQQSLKQPSAQQQQQQQPLLPQQAKQQQEPHDGRGPEQGEEDEEQLVEFAMPASARSTAAAHAAAQDEFFAADDLPEQPQSQVSSQVAVHDCRLGDASISCTASGSNLQQHVSSQPVHHACCPFAMQLFLIATAARQPSSARLPSSISNSRNG